MLFGIDFTCPECGGHTWGTEYAGDPQRARGHCQTCGYSWSRTYDQELFPMAAQLSREFVCDECFPGGEEKGVGPIRAVSCARCGALCGPGAGRVAHHVPTRAALERYEREQEITRKVLDLGHELLELNPEVTSLVLSRQNGFILSMKIDRVRDTVPVPPPDPPDRAS